MKLHQFKHRARILFGAVAILYPLLIFCALVVFKLPIRYLSIFIVVFALIYIILNGRHYRGKNTAILFITPIILCAIGAVCLFTESAIILKIYPALADLAYLIILGTSLFIPPPLVFYLFNLFDKSAKDRIPRKLFDRYCRRATIAWCVFFMIDGTIALCTVFFVSDFLWGLYNGGITYVIMGLIFAAELIILKTIEKRHGLKKDALEANDDHS